jgi:predicted Ser/Thr protein kinase
MTEQQQRRLGKYELLEEIGRGGFGVVYKARDPDLKRPVAIKVLLPQLVSAPGFVARFHREAQAAANLKHPNIVDIHELGREQATEFIVMEFLEGKPLDQLVGGAELLSLDRIAGIIRQLGSALDYAHEKGLIHRDIKPANVIVGARDHATLTDFGLVKALDPDSVCNSGDHVLGTPAYLAPEQVESRPLTGSADLYALGVVAYELCTGKRPFMAHNTTSMCYKIVHETPDPPGQANPRAGGRLGEVLLKAMAKDPAQRYPTGAALVEDLAAAIEQSNRAERDALWRDAQRAAEGGQWQLADEKARAILAIDPDHAMARGLSEKATRYRTADEDYRKLAADLADLRARAEKLRQAAPDLGDTDGTLAFLMASSSAPCENTAFHHRARTTPVLVLAGAMIVVGLVVAVGRFSLQSWAIGNLIIGLGTGLGAVCLAARAFPPLGLRGVGKLFVAIALLGAVPAFPLVSYPQAIDVWGYANLLLGAVVGTGATGAMVLLIPAAFETE